MHGIYEIFKKEKAIFEKQTLTEEDMDRHDSLPAVDWNDINKISKQLMRIDTKLEAINVIRKEEELTGMSAARLANPSSEVGLVSERSPSSKVGLVALSSDKKGARLAGKPKPLSPQKTENLEIIKKTVSKLQKMGIETNIKNVAERR